MRVFVYEYLCGGAATGLTPALRREGWAMLAAVLEDLGRCRGVEPSTRLAPNLADAMAWPRNLTLHTGGPGREEEDLRDLARRADFTLLIAPECHDLLGQRC